MVYFREDQRKFREEVRSFARRELSAGVAERSRLEYADPGVLRKVAAAGFFALTLPEEYGGRPKDCVSIGIAFEELSAVDYTVFALMLSHVLTPLMLQWAAKETRDEWIPLLCKGAKFACFANTEPDCGSDAAAIGTRAVREGGHYVLDGEKTSISGGMQADVALVTAKTDEAAGARGVTCFWVPLDLPGVSRSGFHDLGASSHARASLSFSEVRVPVANRVGSEGEGFTKVMNSFDFARVLVALAGIGMAEQSLEDVAAIVSSRKAFGHSLARYEGVSFKIAEAATLIQASKLLCYNALARRDAGLPHTKDVAMAKWYATASVSNSLHEMLLLCGFDAYTERMPLEQRFRDALGGRLGDGTAEMMKLIIAREILGDKIRPI